MKRLEEIEKRENEQNKRHEQLLTTIETTASNFNQATEITQKRFISVAKHYIERINNDNLKQDFQTAIQDELNEVKSDTQTLLDEVKQSQQTLREEHQAYHQHIDERIKTNETAIKQYDHALNKLTKGITSLFFVIALVMIACVMLSAVGDILGIHHFYDWINHVLKTGHSAWRYLMVLLYLVPFGLLSLLIYAILRAYERF